MKRYNLLLLSILAVFSWNSCSEDFLDVSSATKLYVDDYYTTESRIFEAVVAAYDPLSWFDYAWGQYTNLGLVSDVMSDDINVGGSDANDCIYLHRMNNFSALPTSVCSDLWTTFYSGINRSNIVMQYMDNVTNISSTNKALYLAEAKVLRSFYYTWLWKLWGNVPYYEKNLSAPFTTKQFTADDVYTGIVTNLEDAIDNGGLPMKATSDWYGRVTKAMAYMLYAEVVMYQKDETRYSKALGYMNEIINSGQYKLANDFAGMWETSGEWNDESIFEVNYFSAGGKRAWDNALGDGGSVYPKLIGINTLAKSPDYATGWGFEPVRKEIYQMYEENDQRRDGGILNFATYSAKTGATYVPRYEDTGYFLKKYLPRATGNAGQSGAADMNYDNNFRIYRYAETLLNAAELLARGASGSGSAQSYLDQIRTRAGVGSVSATVDNIINERRLEFVGEGKRYWDLVRCGLAASTLVPNDYRTVSWTESKKYLPIPQAEMDADAGLVQNQY
ncbi:MAG TPA: RagB/SusD family nutrient uptake outer membrane protein [Prolixibacteraceae bacterium]|nr:RagB/SusD family nutrient uptake outer membrane protein [Prolixibacteraceae bacterium]